MKRHIALILAAIVLAGTAYAEEKPWNRTRKEPALQVYKTAGRGIQAFGYHTKKSLVDGNKKVPILGTVMIFEGIGKGTLELLTSTCKGMTGSKPEPVYAHGKLNKIADGDPILTQMRRSGGAAVGTCFADPILSIALGCAQTAVEKHSEKNIAKDDKKNPVPIIVLKKEKHRPSVRKAQERYLGRSMKTGRQIEYGYGNIVKQIRRKQDQ